MTLRKELLTGIFYIVKQFFFIAYVYLLRVTNRKPIN